MSKKQINNNSFFLSLLRGDFLADKNNQKHLPFLLFIVLLLLINISISFRAEKLIMETASLEKQVYDLRLVYITTKSDLMHLYKRSAIQEIVLEQGIKTAVEPPFVITKN